MKTLCREGQESDQEVPKTLNNYQTRRKGWLDRCRHHTKQEGTGRWLKGWRHYAALERERTVTEGMKTVCSIRKGKNGDQRDEDSMQYRDRTVTEGMKIPCSTETGRWLKGWRHCTALERERTVTEEMKTVCSIRKGENGDWRDEDTMQYRDRTVTEEMKTLHSSRKGENNDWRDEDSTVLERGS